MMIAKKIFNKDGDDNNTQVIGGDTTNLFNLNNVKYNWAKSLYRTMMGNFWVPEKVDLTQDIADYHKLEDVEKEALKNILSFLVFLDSIQTTNIPNISNYVTAPEINTLLTIQAYQEAIHSQSYAYIIESVIPADERDEIYDKWRENSLLLERNEYIANIYQTFLEFPTVSNFQRVIVANFILEGVYFYNGFNFFYNLASRNLMLGVADEIRYINRDELTHLSMFSLMIKEMKKENPDWFPPEMIVEMVNAAVSQETNWTNYILDDHVLGINHESTAQYTKFLANRLAVMIGMEPFYSNAKNPYEHLSIYADENNDSVKSNFFESTVTNYNQSSSLNGWEDF